MSVVDVTLRNAGSHSSTTDDKLRVSPSATRVYDVIVDDPSHSEVYVRYNAPGLGLPVEGQSHPDNIYYVAKSIKMTQESPLRWAAEIQYEAPKYKSGQEQQEEQPNPFNQPTEIEFSTISSDEQIDETFDNVPIVTANGEPFDGVTIQISDLTATLTRNYADFQPAAFYAYINSVNSDEFMGFPPGTARVVSIAAKRIFEADFLYWTVTVSIAFRKPYKTTDERAWWKRIRHEGFYVRDPNDADFIQRGVDSQGEVSVVPVLLNEQGYQKTYPEADLTPEAEWLEFEVYPSIDFSGMGLL